MGVGGAPLQRLRFTFAKGEPLKYISHLDLARAWERAFRRARLPLAYSQGYNPRPRFQIAAALPVGVTGRAELLDVWLADRLPPQEALARLHPVLPGGLELLEISEVDLRLPSLQSQICAADYCVEVRTEEPELSVRQRVEALLSAPMLPRRRLHKGEWQSYDLRPLVQAIDVTARPGAALTLSLRLQASPAGAGRPDEVLEALGLSLAAHSIERVRLYAAQAEPLPGLSQATFPV